MRIAEVDSGCLVVDEPVVPAKPTFQALRIRTAPVF